MVSLLVLVASFRDGRHLFFFEAGTVELVCRQIIYSKMTSRENRAHETGLSLSELTLEG